VGGMTVTIIEYKTDVLLQNSESDYWWNESEQRDLLFWFKKNKPELVLEVFGIGVSRD